MQIYFSCLDILEETVTLDLIQLSLLPVNPLLERIPLNMLFTSFKCLAVLNPHNKFIQIM